MLLFLLLRTAQTFASGIALSRKELFATGTGWSAVRNAAEGPHMDIVLETAWRLDDKLVKVRAAGGREVNESPRSVDETFMWRRGKVEISLARDGESWRVAQSTTGRLFGPRQLVYEQRHKLVRQAALDFMARVIRETRNEDEGIRVARDAARWMNGQRDGLSA